LEKKRVEAPEEKTKTQTPKKKTKTTTKTKLKQTKNIKTINNKTKNA